MKKQILYKGTPGFWEVIEGSLPQGVELNPETGVLKWVPEKFGKFPITFKFTNPCGQSIKEVVVITRGGSFKRSAFNKAFK